MAILIMVVIGMLSLFYCFFLQKKKNKLTDVADVTSEENTTVDPRNSIISTKPLINDFTYSKNSEDVYEMNNNEVLDYNSKYIL